MKSIKIITVLLYSSNGKKCKDHLKVAVVISSEIYCFTNSWLVVYQVVYKLTIFIQNCNTCSVLQIDTLSFVYIIVIFRRADLSSNQPCCNEAAEEVKTWHQTEASHGPRKLEETTKRKTQI